MSNKSKKESLPPKCLNLRIHSSILFGSHSGNELYLPRDIAVGSRKRKIEGNVKDSRGGHVFSLEDNAGVSHVYMSAGNESSRTDDTNNNVDGRSSKSRFDFLASSAPKRILVQPSIDGIDELGRRARARLEQQRQNRKGIKVIEDTKLIIEQTQKDTKPKATANITSGKKRQRPKARTQQSSSTKFARKSEELPWTPDISHIPILPKHSQSNYVQIHGLPIGSTHETVRRFFTGLNPERIQVVLSNRTHIWELDASSYGKLKSFGLQDLIYTNRDVRILVKFDSTTTAGFAADRSGETITPKQIYEDTSYDGVADHRQNSFSIGVTNISKKMAYSLSKFSIDAFPGVPFQECLSSIESKLHPKVREVLWTSAKKACGVALDDEIKSANLLIATTNRDDKSCDKLRLFSFSEYKKHSIHYNRLLRIQEDLMTSIRNKNADIEASISVDPIIRLTTHACAVLDHELDRIDSQLYQCRATRFV